MHVVDTSDIIVLLPASPGSFMEFGAFALNIKSSSKLLVFIEKQYEGKQSFINIGPVQMARNDGASVIYEDYRKLDILFHHIEDHLTE